LLQLQLLFFFKRHFADSATWNLNPTSSDWLLATSWTPTTVPNGRTVTATFGASNMTDVGGVLSSSIEVNGIGLQRGSERVHD
jgi:hypothetical protein